MKIEIPKSERKVFTISNFFSISRILLLPVILVILKQEVNVRNNVLLMALVGIAILTDYLDGFLARKLNQISVVGKVLDPIADKICIGAMVIFLTLYRDFPVWIAVIIIGRDMLIILAAFLLVSKVHRVMPSNLIGKFTVTFLAFLIVSYLFEIQSLQFPLTILALLSILMSLISYGYRLVKSFSKGSNV